MLSNSLIEERLRKIIPIFNFIPQQKTIEYLKSRGIKLEGRKCSMCGAEITLNNIGLIFEKGEHVLFVCTVCLSKYNLFTLYNELLKQTTNE